MVFPSQAVQRIFPAKVGGTLEELPWYAEGKEVTAQGASLPRPPAGFIYVPSSTESSPSSASSAGAGGFGAGATAGAQKRPVVVGGGRLGAPTTARGFSGMAPAASGAPLVKSTLVK